MLWGALALVTATFTLWVDATRAQVPCQEPLVLPRDYAWPANRAVRVNIGPGFEPDHVAAIKDAFRNWNNAGGSGVTFTVTQSSTPITGNFTVQIDRRATTSSVWRGETGGNVEPDQHRLSAFMNIDPRVTTKGAMFSAISHEIGHTFGLNDCERCPAGTSAMSGAADFNDATSVLTEPSPCDHAAAKRVGQYPNPIPTPTPVPTPTPSPSPTPRPRPGPGQVPRPGGCGDCVVRDCVTSEVCVFDRQKSRWDCGPRELNCYDRPGCCRADVSASEPDPCGEWERADGCDGGGVCCLDPAIADAPPGCASEGWRRNQANCEEACDTECAEGTITVFASDGSTETNQCWTCPAPQLPTCGAMGGDQCGAGGVCPPGSIPLATSGDCTPCCITCESTGCPAGSCGWQTDNCGAPLWCGECLSTCGGLGGDHCSQSGSCPPGYDYAGPSSDCRPCCVKGPSCGARGGDHCSESSACPPDHLSLGQTWDCVTCCLREATPQRTCGEMGGNHCSQTGGCPENATSLGQSTDCNPCCVTGDSEPPPPPGCGHDNQCYPSLRACEAECCGDCVHKTLCGGASAHKCFEPH